MKIRIRDKIIQYYSTPEYNKSLASIAGKVVEVDTEYLFKDQFNVVDPPLRVHLSDVAEVLDDLRPYRKRCTWCGKNCSWRETQCPSCLRFNYLEELAPRPANSIAFIMED